MTVQIHAKSCTSPDFEQVICRKPKEEASAISTKSELSFFCTVPQLLITLTCLACSRYREFQTFPQATNLYKKLAFEFEKNRDLKRKIKKVQLMY